MKHGTRSIRMFSFLAAGLLALAGVWSGADRASAQANAACPLPPGLTPPAGPSVTARQVEDGAASLKDFALSSRDRLRSYYGQGEDLAKQSYVGCLVRHEGSAWRSGSTYLVQLTPDGRVFIHAKDMSLSGKLLDPRIYATILSRLGVPPAVLADLASPDPAVAVAAGAAIMATLAQEPDAAFDAGLPGASGHATVYVSATLGLPILLLAGFDLGPSHLAEERIDHAEPAVTARDVVDRATLKAFVTEAGKYIVDLSQSGGVAGYTKITLAMTDPNGPWRHGPVYLSLTDRISNVILFHAGFPNRLMLRPPGISRDPDTGELIWERIVAAAESGPEGGFLQYRFDNPDDDTDAEVLKIGYARAFEGKFRRPDGGEVPYSFIVQSGFYPSSPNVVAASRNAVVETVLPQVLRATMASAVDAISGRVRQAASGAPAEREASLAGASTLPELLMAGRGALGDGAFDPGRLLADSSFVLPFQAAGGGGSGPLGNLTLWGSGDYRSLSGGSGGSIAYDGAVTGGSIGIDAGLGADLLAGLSVAHGRGRVDYTDANALEGKLSTGLTSVNPYVGWAPGGVTLWAAAGWGTGEVEIADSNGAEASDLTQRMFAAGAGGTLLSSDRAIPGGTTELALKAETAFARAEIEGSETLRSGSMNVSRHRLALEGSHSRKLASGATLAPSVEIGMRRDGGDGETGGGVEAGGGLRYSDASSGLTVEGRVRTLLGHGGDSEETGVSGSVRLDPGREGRGLSLRLRPSWGRTASGARRLWESGLAGAAPSLAQRAAGRMDARIGYGLAAPGGLGVVTPYAELGFAGERARSLRLGARWRAAPSASLSLEGARREGAGGDAAEHGLMLRGAIIW